MDDKFTFLKSLISTSGLSGFEAPVRQKVAAAWEPLTDEINTSRLGSLHGLKTGSGEQPRDGILLAAHMDAIGLMVTSKVEGFLRVTEMGGIDGRVLPGQAVTVHGREELDGAIALPPKHLLPPHLHGRAVPLEYLLVDVGLFPSEVESKVQVGDLVSFAQPPIEMGKDILAGHSLDNRASVAAVTACLTILRERTFEWNVWAAATVQEEETFGGAYTSAFELNPKLAVAIDVTHGAGPGTKEHMTVPFGKGPALGWGPNIHPALHEAFKMVAERFEIPHILEPIPRHSGTDAFAMQVAAAGIPTMVISIPLRYMHTPVEMVVLKDITRAARLLAEFIVELDDGFMKKLAWDTEL